MQIIEIRVAGHIAEDWSHWFEDMSLSYGDQETRLVGPVADQAALYGLLARLRDLGLTLVSVNPVEGGDAEPDLDREPDLAGFSRPARSSGGTGDESRAPRIPARRPPDQ